MVLIEHHIKHKEIHATCIKSEVGSWEEDITGRNLYDLFVDNGMM